MLKRAIITSEVYMLLRLWFYHKPFPYLPPFSPPYSLRPNGSLPATTDHLSYVWMVDEGGRTPAVGSQRETCPRQQRDDQVSSHVTAEWQELCVPLSPSSLHPSLSISLCSCLFLSSLLLFPFSVSLPLFLSLPPFLSVFPPPLSYPLFFITLCPHVLQD